MKFTFVLLILAISGSSGVASVALCPAPGGCRQERRMARRPKRYSVSSQICDNAAAHIVLPSVIGPRIVVQFEC